MNIAELVRYWARWRPDHTAVITDDVRTSWAEFDARSDAIARGLRGAGVGKGDRVGMHLDNRIEAPLLTIACLKLGAIIVPLNFKLTGSEILPLLEDADCRIVVSQARYLPQLELAAARLPFAIFSVDGTDVPGFAALSVEQGPAPVESIALSDPGFICYTSGTTGRQKGALLTHGSAMYPGFAKNVAEGLTWRDSIMVAVPFVFTGAIVSCFIQLTVNAGGTMVLESDFDIDRYLDVIQRHRVSAATTVPVVWERLMRSPGFESADLSCMISAAAGGAPVSIDLIEAYRAKGVSLIQSYGLTEASGLAATMHGEDAMAHIGWAGLPIMGSEMRSGDADGRALGAGEIGEIMVRGPHVMREYWRNPEATAATIVDGWLRTGDTGMMNAEGFVKVVDRSKDMIISGGINIYPAEIEKVLSANPHISELAVIGVPDREWGEVPMIVASRCGDQAAAMSAIEGDGSAQLAPFKRPRRIVFIDEPLPRTLSGKVSKPTLRGRFPAVPAGARALFAK
jgi:acyl-CoA synthetase (AMP-forming)/AMP-acid ligase II